MTFNPTAVDLTTLPWLPLEDTSAFPARACIYFAIDSLGTVQYIGRSVNVRQRWAQHHKYEALSGADGVKIAYLFVDAPELLPEIEKALITFFHQRNHPALIWRKRHFAIAAALFLMPQILG